MNHALNLLVKIWNALESKLITTLTGHTHDVRSLALLQNGYLASGSWDNTIKIWNALESKLITTLTGHTNYVNSLAVLQNGYLASGSHDNTIKIWNISP